jgi:hypothetical protein
MPAWLQSLLNRPQTIVWFAFIAFVVVSSIIKKIKAEKLKREIKQRQAQAELDRLRTGGIEPVTRTTRQVPLAPQHTPMMPAPDGPTPSPRQASLEEIAEARRRKIAEMRSRQTAGSPTGPASQGTRVVRLPNGVTIEVPTGTTTPRPLLRRSQLDHPSPSSNARSPGAPCEAHRAGRAAASPSLSPPPPRTQAPSPLQMTPAGRVLPRAPRSRWLWQLGSDRGASAAIILSEVLPARRRGRPNTCRSCRLHSL